MSRTKLAADAWGSLLRVHATVVPDIDKTMQREAGLQLRWYDVLLELSSASNGRLTMGELADRVVLSRSRVSRVVDDLDSYRLVRREVNEADRRSAYALITPLGEQRFAEAAPIYRKAIVEAFASGLSDSDLAYIRDALGRVISKRRSRGAVQSK